MKIVDISALQILDSRGNPTLSVKVVLEDGSSGEFSVPSGASTGVHEAHELRDGNLNVFHGKSVERAVENVYRICDEVLDRDFTQRSLDEELIRLDGSDSKELLGANAILGVSVAFAKACAKFYNLPIYEYLRRVVAGVSFESSKLADLEEVFLFANVINGGLHSGNSLNVQEFMLVPVFGKLQDKVRAVSEIYFVLKGLIEEKYGKSNTAVGDEGGFAPDISKCSEALDLLVLAIKNANYFGQVMIALDAAASDFYDKDSGLYEVEEGLKLDYRGLSDFYNDLIEKYPIVSIEDPMAEDDFEGFSYFMHHVKTASVKSPFNKKKGVLVVGDDLLVTNPSRIEIAKEKGLCNSLLLKINQIGTLSESIEAFKLAQGAGWSVIVSHRSGETCDSFISDLAVAFGSSIKLGAPARGERVAKYNRLLQIYR